MTIQRQYILPNCNLTLEGLSTAVEPALEEVMSVVMNAECHFPAAKTTLKGGREFLDGLVGAVNQYGQSFLSGLPARPTADEQMSPVQIKPGNDAHHHLLIQPQVLSEGSLGEDISSAEHQGPQDIELTTVQLFDLLEAIDQLVADAQTLPDLKFKLQPLSRRLVQPSEPVAQRALPAAVGVSSLAAAAIAMALLPVPEVSPPEEPNSDGETSEASVNASTPSTDELNIDPSEAPEAVVDAVTAAAVLDNRPETAPEITDNETLEQLRQQLTEDLQAAWGENSSFDEDLRFRVGVSETGDILGYKYENDAALLNVDDTPLPGLTYVPVDPEAIQQEPMAQFFVTFATSGVVEVESANPTAATDTADAAQTTAENEPTETTDSEPEERTTDSEAAADTPSLPDVIGNEITDGETIRTLNRQLYDAVAAEFESTSYPEDITYRVRLNDAGDIVGYEPVDSVARSQADQTPLPDLVDEAVAADRPQVDFKLVFTEGGVIQVNPWQGWP